MDDTLTIFNKGQEFQVRHEVACRSCSHNKGGNRPCHRVNLGV